jgi:predicted nucleic acid-binding protein
VQRGVVDSGVAISWLLARARSRARIERLFQSCRTGRLPLTISVVNLAEVLAHTSQVTAVTGADPVVMLKGIGVGVHQPDEAVARRVARLRTSLADGFAAATAQELGARLHTTDDELVRQLRGTGLLVTHY